MAEENKQHMEKKEEHTEKHDHSKHEHVEKKEDKKVQKVTKKDEAMVRGDSMHISKRHAMYISQFIKGKKIDSAIKDLEDVIAYKRAVPFKGEIPHRKGMMSGRYPQNASREFIRMLKGLRGNVLVNGMNLDKTVIFTSTSNWAARPARRGGQKGKRTHVVIVAREQGEKK